ncbi:uncharacterized protein N0V89_011508 [Didymosphaeria variabile]|uniref:C3H1-type domain-containing protein n=1 Tax=Didymosphaeria variabile TaxID=1932322 RepID=A0A9W9C6G7_9PLEO|nr:uncharacterized protein N0V89_011508 [Didymosphaeria variabile]KAJ4345378.1 hypothetical protein N0V89_011508 [Didymosphaeria variabile]
MCRRGGSSGRGDRGRGRGGVPRGRGHHQGNARAGHQRGGHRGGQQHHGGRGGSQNYGAPNNSYQQQQQHSNTAAQSYPNTNFAPAYQNPAPLNPPTNGVPPLAPGAFAQAMAFMATPAGMQTMAAFAANMASGSAAPAYGQAVPPQHPTPQSQSSHPQPSPRKRKRNERVEQWHAQPPPNHTHPRTQSASTQKPPRAKAKAPPSIPGFGFSLPPVPQPSVTSKPGGGHNHNQKRMNLGLTSLNYDEQSSSEEEGEEDVDEEAAFAAKWDGKGLQFEHNGETISLQSAAEFAEYIKDRKRNFPTQQRIAEKAQRAAEKRTSELDFLRRVKGISGRKDTGAKSGSSNGRQKKDGNKQSKSTKPKLEELREKVKASMSSKHPPPSTTQQAIDLGLGYGTDTESDDISSILSASSVVSSLESSDDDASQDENEDSDTPPEAQSSKAVPAPIVPPPRIPDHKVEDPNQAKTRVCPQWKATGKCKYKYCKYRHAEEELKRVGLYERMVEQELEKADCLALEAIKYLGRNGFLG